MVTEARKRANAKWDKENMVVLACKVTRETAEQAVKAYLEEHPAPEQPHTAGNAPDDDTEARRAALLESIKGL